MDDDKSYCGFENGQDWLDDLAIEDYLLNKEGATMSKKGDTYDQKN